MLVTHDSPAAVEKVSTAYTVRMNVHRADDSDAYETYTVARFVAHGDAVAYAIWRAHTVPDGKLLVFEVFKGSKRVYRAG